MAIDGALKEELAAAEKELLSVKERVAKLRASLAESVSDYTFQSLAGDIQLSELFGRKEDLIVVHNMGKSCVYCTMWADGLNGLLPHLQDQTRVKDPAVVDYLQLLRA